MSNYRAEKSGLAADAMKKIQSKWDKALAVDAMGWVSKNTGEPLPAGYDGDSDATQEWLKNGVILCKLANWVKPNSIKPNLYARPPTLAFKQMELIGLFVTFLKNENLVHESELFQTVNLYEATDMPSVLFSIGALGRTMQKQGRGFGVAESQGTKKEWTEEQLKAGQNVIGLQMGTNKGANQSGLNMGKSRAIMD